MIAEKLIIDWGTIKFYNTVMAITAGAGLASIASVMSDVTQRVRMNPRGWAMNFGVLGILGFSTGIHMTLTWPLAPRYAYDNISFGEPMAVLGALLLGLSFFFWKRADAIEEKDDPVSMLAKDLRNFRYILYGVGIGLIAIGVASLAFGLFTAPPEEPIAGLTAEWGMTWLTTVPLSLLWMAIGVVALLIPDILERLSVDGADPTTRDTWIITALKYLGWVLIVVGGVVYGTHIGMVIHTSTVITK